MSLKAKANNGGDFDPIASGMHQAVCFSVIDIGTQPQPPGVNWPAKAKVLITWELPNERIDIERDGEKENIPRVISARYTNSLHKKSALRPMLESWRGRPFTDEELEGFELSKLLGVNCFLNIVHNRGEGKHAGKTFANVASVNPLPKGTPKIEAENELISFDLDEQPQNKPIEFPASMPEWQVDLIKQSDEYQNHGKPDPKSDPKNPDGEAFPQDTSNPDLEPLPF